MVQLILCIASGGYTGYLPKAPGTWGSLVALPIHFLLTRLAPERYWAALVGIFLLAVYTAGSAEKIIDRKDPGIIVIDEIVGMLIALIAIPASPVLWVAAFLLFRFFDIVKPWPVSWADRHLNGGLGVVMDDVLAGVYAWLALHGALLFVSVFSQG